MLQLGWRVLSAFFGLYGTGDEGEALELADGQQVRRLPQPQRRVYQSVSGAFALTRAVYGSREGQKVVAIPFDQRLQLPESKFSYLLQDWNQALEVEMPFAQGCGISRPHPSCRSRWRQRFRLYRVAVGI